MLQIPEFLRNIDGFFRASLLFPVAEIHQKRNITPKLRILRKEANASFEIRKRNAQKRLANSLIHAGATVPYYKNLFRQLNFDPAKVLDDIKYLEKLPFLTKEILREQGKNLISKPYLQKICREQKTGSSTGPAATIYYDQDSLDWTAAQNILVLEWGGKKRYNRETHLSTLFTSKPPPNVGRKEFVLNRFNIYTSGFDENSQKKLLSDLYMAQAKLVQGHPSSLYALAKYVQQNGINAKKLFKIFVSTGEMISPKQRKTIENVFGARVSNRYGACEFGVMAQELAAGPYGEMLVNDSMVWPESCDPDSDGIGELVFTNLRNPAMPLIRYKMGDLGELEERSDGWWIKKLTGRIHDSVNIDGTNYPTHFIQDILDRCGKIDDFQILVDKTGRAKELRLVTDERNWANINKKVRSYFPNLMAKRIDLKDIIFTGIRGKFSYLVREKD